MLSIVLSALAPFSSVPITQAPSLADYFDVERHDVQDLILPDSAGSPFSVAVDLDGAEHLLELAPYDLRAADFQLVVHDELGYHTVAAPAPATYRGTLVGDPDSDVRVSLIDGRLRGTVTDGWGQRWAVQPADEADGSLPPSAHVVYSQADVRALSGHCGVTEEAVLRTPAPTAEGGGLKQAQIAFDADFEYYASNDQSVVETTNDIESVLNAMEAIFESDVQVTFELTVVLIRTAEPDPYSQLNALNLLNQFSGEWISNQGGFKRDLTHLMTGKVLQGSILGIANLDALCAGGYGVSRSRFTNNFSRRVGLTTHEVGHTMGSPHCNATEPCFIMCSRLEGCSESLEQFGPFAINQINSGVASALCVVDLPPPLAPPFFEDFEGGDLDPAHWTHVDSVTLELSTLLEPSGVAAAVLDALNGDPAKQADLRSNEILLGSGTPWVLSYYVNDNGVDAGEELVVEFHDQNENWVELDRVISDGVTSPNFELRSFALPPAARHDAFRLRLRSLVDDLGDNWHVDSVSIDTAAPCPIPQVHCAGKLNSQGCVPAIGFTGQSDSAGSGPFLIGAAGAVTQQSGLLLYGYETATIPFQDGSLCALPPLRRTTIQGSGGINGFFCDGTFSFDFNALIQSGADPELSAGQRVSAQYWYRDPGAVSQTGLTNGLSFDICP